MNRQLSSKKKPKLSPNEKFLKTIYSKPKPKSEYSPSGYRSISKEQIKQEIKKAVRQAGREERWESKKEEGVSNIRTSLTPKSFYYPKKVSQRQVQSTKAGDNKGKDLFSASGRYDLKQLFERKKQQQSQRGERERFASGQKKNNFVESKLNEDHTIKINERERERERDDLFNVRAFLTPDEYSKFGQRFPQKFKRVGLLGRGGFSVVWLGIHRSSKRKIAIKQILTKNPHQTHLKQIWFGSYFFEKGGQPREQFESHIGINNICRLYSYQIRSVDSWLYYELCDQSLGSSIFQLKAETIGGERSYRIEYKQLIYRMRENELELKVLIVEVCKALLLMNSHNIVHSDLKTQNILVKTRRRQSGSNDENYIRGVKLIDFGSSFLFTNLKQFSMATPQYMPPQILNYILYQNKLDYDEQMLLKMEKYRNPWVIDIWSLGCIVLQIVSGVPLWMSIETRVQDSNIRVTGLYAVKNRVFGKIIQKQIEVVSNLDYHLDYHNYSKIHVTDDIRRVMKRMLSLNPDERISPFQVLTEFGVDCEPVRVPSF